MGNQNSTRVAVATSDGKKVDLHFGRTRAFQVIDLFHDGSWLTVREEQVGERPAENDVIRGNCGGCQEQKGCQGHNEEYVLQVAQQLSDCKYLLLAKIGGRPSRIFLRYGIEVLEQEGDLNGILKKIAIFLSGRYS